MTKTKRILAGLCASALAVSLGACSGEMNQSLYSTKQPVVERTHYTLDLAGGPGGLPISEQRRLAGWFEALDLGYGDRVTIEEDTASAATIDNVGAIVERYGIMLSDLAPVTEGKLPGSPCRRWWASQAKAPASIQSSGQPSVAGESSVTLGRCAANLSIK